MKRIGYFLVIASFLFLKVQAQNNEELVVFAAASLTDTFEAIAEEFEQENPGVTVLFNFGGSSTLATQLIQGAPADVFASANDTQMQVAVDEERIAGTPVTFAKNRLVVIVPADNPANITSLDDLAKPGINLVLAAPEVPVRAYTDIMLERMADDLAYGADYRTSVIENIVSEEPHVRQVSAKVALGEADAGVVYLSDVTPDIADDVITIPIPDNFNTIASYPIALVTDSNQPELAQKFVDFVLSDVGQGFLEEWGFVSVSTPALPDTVQIPSDGTLLVDGKVLNPMSLTVDTLRTEYKAETVDVTYLGGDETVSATFTGVLLWDIVANAQPDLDMDIHNDQLSMYIIVTGYDGYQAVISWGEMDPEYANQPILIVYEENGVPISEEDGNLRLVVPGDMRGGRYVSGVANISLRDAPVPMKQQ